MKKLQTCGLFLLLISSIGCFDVDVVVDLPDAARFMNNSEDSQDSESEDFQDNDVNSQDAGVTEDGAVPDQYDAGSDLQDAGVAEDGATPNQYDAGSDLQDAGNHEVLDSGHDSGSEEESFSFVSVLVEKIDAQGTYAEDVRSFNIKASQPMKTLWLNIWEASSHRDFFSSSYSFNPSVDSVLVSPGNWGDKKLLPNIEYYYIISTIDSNGKSVYFEGNFLTGDFQEEAEKPSFVFGNGFEYNLDGWTHVPEEIRTDMASILISANHYGLNKSLVVTIKQDQLDPNQVQVCHELPIFWSGSIYSLSFKWMASGFGRIITKITSSNNPESYVYEILDVNDTSTWETHSFLWKSPSYEDHQSGVSGSICFYLGEAPETTYIDDILVEGPFQ